MEFQRDILEHLQNWKNDPNRKPLVLRGARQVGKTTAVKQLSKSYKQFIHLNLEKNQDRAHFEKHDEVKKVIDSLFLTYDLSDDYTSTLLFIDEIQELPKAIQMLRYFYEELSELHVIAAGSLLEFAMGDVKSFPVGRITYMYMFPLNFEEFLLARAKTRLLKVLNKLPIDEVAHSALIGQFHEYAIIGGMPEVVQRYIDNESLIQLPSVYESIWATYKDDVQKYAKNDSEKRVIAHILNTAATQLDQRVKFQHFGNSNYKSREVSEALRRLDDARLIQLIYPTTSLDSPIQPDYKKAPRLQFLDTGLVNHALNIQPELLTMDDLSDAYRGALIPHLVAQQQISRQTFTDKRPNFWVREKNQSSAEVDLVIAHNKMLIPVEIKSGKTGKLKSLHQFVDACGHPYAIRLYAGSFNVETHTTQKGTTFLLMNLPYYLGTKLPEYITYFLNNYHLGDSKKGHPI